MEKGTESVLDGYGQGEYYDPQLPLSVAELRKRLKLKEGGDDYIFATTLSGGQKS